MMFDDEDDVRRIDCESTAGLPSSSGSGASSKQKQMSPLALTAQSTTCAVCGDTAAGIWFKTAVCTGRRFIAPDYALLTFALGCKIFFRRVVVDNKRYSVSQDAVDD